jgi:hypothetical protein
MLEFHPGVHMKISLIIATLLCLSSCKKPPTQDPVSTLNALVKEYGYIGYQNPVQESGTGVLFGGSPKKLAYVAPAQDCFPEDELERFYDTQHFKKSYSYLFKGSLGFTTFGTALFSLGAKFTQDLYIEVEIEGLTIEYLSSIAISEWYRSGMSETCKRYLDQVGFVIQALSTDKMSISIRNAKGVTISLDSGMLNQYIRILPSVNYEIVEGYKVVITTPKYIGYQLGRLRLEDKGHVLYRAMTADQDKFIFTPISIFASEELASQNKSFVEMPPLPSIDKHARYKSQ